MLLIVYCGQRRASGGQGAWIPTEKLAPGQPPWAGLLYVLRIPTLFERSYSKLNLFYCCQLANERTNTEAVSSLV